MNSDKPFQTDQDQADSQEKTRKIDIGAQVELLPKDESLPQEFSKKSTTLDTISPTKSFNDEDDDITSIEDGEILEMPEEAIIKVEKPVDDAVEDPQENAEIKGEENKPTDESFPFPEKLGKLTLKIKLSKSIDGESSTSSPRSTKEKEIKPLKPDKLLASILTRRSSTGRTIRPTSKAAEAVLIDYVEEGRVGSFLIIF